MTNPFRLSPLPAPEVHQLADALKGATPPVIHPDANGYDANGLIDIWLVFPDRPALEAYRDRHNRTFISDGATVTCWVTYAGEWLDERGYGLRLAADHLPHR